jgi:hypothetical protein
MSFGRRVLAANHNLPNADKMTRNVLHVALGAAVLSALVLPIPVAAQSDEAQRIQESATVLNEIMGAPDKAIPNLVLSKAEGIAIFPGAVKDWQAALAKYAK